MAILKYVLLCAIWGVPIVSVAYVLGGAGLAYCVLILLLGSTLFVMRTGSSLLLSTIGAKEGRLDRTTSFFGAVKSLCFKQEVSMPKLYTFRAETKLFFLGNVTGQRVMACEGDYLDRWITSYEPNSMSELFDTKLARAEIQNTHVISYICMMKMVCEKISNIFIFNILKQLVYIALIIFCFPMFKLSEFLLTKSKLNIETPELLEYSRLYNQKISMIDYILSYLVKAEDQFSDYVHSLLSRCRQVEVAS